MERRCVEKLRGTFGLKAVPYTMGMPIINGCNVNESGFQIDFMIPSDCISGWVPDQQGVLHPKVATNVTFVGEYFGFDFTRPVEVNARDGSDGLYDIDGSIAKWKKMTEDFWATVSNNSSIHLDAKLNDRDIMAELDRQHIIYNTAVCPLNDASCSIASHQLIAHIKSGKCQDPNCDARRYVHEGPDGHAVVTTQFSPAQAYIKCAIAGSRRQLCQ
jgi:hypothetical protein